MNNILKWSLVGALTVAVLAAVIFFLPSHTPFEQNPDMKWHAPVDVELDLPPMPQMSVDRKTYDEEATQPEDQEEVAAEPPRKLPYKMEEDTPPPPPEKKEELKKPVSAIFKDKRPKIAIIIDDMGLSNGLTGRALRLPKEITMAYLPYAPDLKKQTADAKKAGHDLMLHMPMEPIGKHDPGPGALRVNQSTEEWERLIEQNLNSMEDYVGVNNHMGSKFTKDGRGLAFVAHALSQRGLFFVDSRTSAGSVGAKVMRVMNVKAATRDVFLDHVVTKKAIWAELARAEALARQNGSVIAIAHPHKATLSVLEEWVTKPSTKKYHLVPVRELVK